MKLKINNFIFNLKDFYFINNIGIGTFLDKNENFQSVEDFYTKFDINNPITVKILDNDTELNNFEDIYFNIIQEQITDSQTESSCFFIKFLKEDPNLIIAKNTANIDYLATMLDIELEEM